MPRGIRSLAVVLAALAGLILVSLALIQEDREIRTEILIDAPPEQVWRVLAETSAYPAWNPFLISFKGALAAGEKLEITARPPGGSEMSFSPRVLSVTPNRELAWRGDLPVPGLFQGDHRFQLEPVGDGRTRFLHSERFTGLLIGPLMKATLDSTELGFTKMNQALKVQTEKRR